MKAKNRIRWIAEMLASAPEWETSYLDDIAEALVADGILESCKVCNNPKLVGEKCFMAGEWWCHPQLTVLPRNWRLDFNRMRATAPHLDPRRFGSGWLPDPGFTELCTIVRDQRRAEEALRTKENR